MYSWYTYTYTSAHFIIDSGRVKVVFSVCVLLIKILLTRCQPCQTCLFDREASKNKHTNKSKQANNTAYRLQQYQHTSKHKRFTY